MTTEQEDRVCEVARRLAARSGTAVLESLPWIADLADARAALAMLGFPPGQLTLEFLALVCIDEVSDRDCVGRLREITSDELFAARMVMAAEWIDEHTFDMLAFENVSRRLSVDSWRQFRELVAAGAARGAYGACEIVEPALALGLLKGGRIDSMLCLQELSVDAQALLESEANVYPAGPFPLPEGMHWVRDGGEAAQLMRSHQGRLSFVYENMPGSYHAGFTGKSQYLGVNSDGVLFSFTWFRCPTEPLQRSPSSPAA